MNEEPTLVRVRDVARRHGMRRLAPDVFPYLALAAEVITEAASYPASGKRGGGGRGRGRGSCK